MDELIVISMGHPQESIHSAIQNYGKSLFRFIRNRVKSDEDAEDILQDVWYSLSSIIDIEPIEQLSAWLYKVSRNRITDKLRKQSSLSLEDLAYEDENGEMVFPEVLLSDNEDQEILFEREYLSNLFLEALAELPEKQRQVFIWNEMEDMTLQEIADKTGENLKTIISRKRYAVAQLRKLLKKWYYE
jgi:RNA polymerase sigma factor (sigma-70 family)